ncbi:MAG: LysR substrate-binding domain-containing protein [Burkholderiaceae bacterium]
MPTRPVGPRVTARPPPSAAPGDPSSVRFTLRQLESFALVLQTGSVSEAARRLSRTQSAISMSLKDLENALGTPLFERRGRRLVRTDAAERLLPRALELVDRANDMNALVGTHQTGAGQIALGASRTVGPFVMPGLLAACQASHPAVSVQLVVANSEDLMRQLREFHLDCAFVEGDVSDSSLDREAWLQDRLCVVARSGHPIFRSRRGQTEQRLADYGWTLRERGSGTREIFLRAIHPIIGAPRIAIELNEPETQKRLVRQTDLLSCISHRAIGQPGIADGLREVTDLSAGLRAALTRRFWIVRHPQRFQSEALRAVVDEAHRMNSPS